MRQFADASREVGATDCATDGDPRELLQRQWASVEVAQESPHVVEFGGPTRSRRYNSRISHALPRDARRERAGRPGAARGVRSRVPAADTQCACSSSAL